MLIYKQDIERFLCDKEEEFRYTEELNIVTREIIYFFDDRNKLIDIAVNNLEQYKNGWDN